MASRLKATFGAACLLALFTHGAAAAPNVVATILPVYSLVSGVMEGVATPHLLIEANSSPHAYALKPSDARALQHADVVFWVGDTMESFLAKPISALSARARVVALIDEPEMVLLPARKGGAWADGEDREAHADAHDHGAFNPHIWLDPKNAEIIVRAAVDALGAADPANAARYAANGERLQRRLAALDAYLERDVAGVRHRPYIVFHDSYQYFEARYGLTGVGAIAVSPERLPGARRIAELRASIAKRGAVCVFSEPQFKPAVVRTIVDGTGARTGVLDPLGVGLTLGPDAYFTLMTNLARALRDCLTAPEK